MKPNDIYQQMAEIALAPDYPLLQHYKQDLTVHDRQFLDHVWHPDGRLLWIVRESGTHLIPLGICQEVSSWGHAAISMHGPQNYYLVDAQGVHAISRSAAQTALNKYDWSRENSQIWKNDKLLAGIQDIKIWREDNKIYTQSSLTAATDIEHISLGDLIGLAQMTEQAAIAKAGTFFCSHKSITLSGMDLHELLDRKREIWLNAPQDIDQVTLTVPPRTNPVEALIP